MNLFWTRVTLTKEIIIEKVVKVEADVAAFLNFSSAGDHLHSLPCDETRCQRIPTPVIADSPPGRFVIWPRPMKASLLVEYYADA
jgi:hypothetical protein